MTRQDLFLALEAGATLLTATRGLARNSRAASSAAPAACPDTIKISGFSALTLVRVAVMSLSSGGSLSSMMIFMPKRAAEATA